MGPSARLKTVVVATVVSRHAYPLKQLRAMGYTHLLASNTEEKGWQPMSDHVVVVDYRITTVRIPALDGVDVLTMSTKELLALSMSTEIFEECSVHEVSSFEEG